jgi:MFS-type transporter involved in bile tolerance (Atg22 family)
MGPFLFARVNDLTSSLRYGILSIIVLFIVGLGILLTVNVPRAFAEAGRKQVPLPAGAAAQAAD